MQEGNISTPLRWSTMFSSEELPRNLPAMLCFHGFAIIRTCTCWQSNNGSLQKWLNQQNCFFRRKINVGQCASATCRGGRWTDTVPKPLSKVNIDTCLVFHPRRVPTLLRHNTNENQTIRSYAFLALDKVHWSLVNRGRSRGWGNPPIKPAKVTLFTMIFYNSENIRD